MKVKHTKGRPPKGAEEVIALNERGRWIADDGKRHRAFSFRHHGFPFAMWSDCDCSLGDWRCPGRRAMEKTGERWGCANGRPFGGHL